MTRNGVLFLLLFGGLLTVISFLGSSYVSSTLLHREGLTPLVQIASLAVFSQGIIQSATSALLGWNAMRAISSINIIQALLKFLVATALVILGFGVMGAILGLISSYFVAGGVAILALYYVTRSTAAERDGSGGFLDDNIVMLRYGFPHHIGNLVSGLALQFVTVVLALVTTSVVVGYYQSAYNILSAISVVSSALTLSLFPAFAHLEGIQANIALAFRYAVKYTSFVVAPIIFYLVGAATPIIQVLYGPSFTSAETYLLLLSLSNLPLLMGFSTFPSFFSGVGKTRFSMYFFLVEALLQFSLAPILGVFLGLGVPGLIYSILISNLSATVFALYLARRNLGVFIDVKALIATSAASVVSCAALIPFQGHESSPVLLLIIDTAVFVIVYLTTAPLFGSIGRDDIVRLSIATSGMGFLSRLLDIILGYEKQVLRLRAAI
jgi:O-antigen/teichoic acid export membrane protein